jgi:hypothetical protein
MKRASLLVMLLIALLPANAAAKPLGKTAKIGDWNLGAFSNDQTHRFSHCGAWGAYKSGIMLFFLVTRDYEWAIAFQSPTFTATPGESVFFRISLDDSDADQVQAYALARDFVRVSLAPTSTLYKRFMSANTLRMYTADNVHTFNLTDTSKLLPALLKCVRDRLNPPPLNAQGPAPQQRQTDARTSPDLRAEVTSLAANLLSEAGVSGFRLVSSDNKMSVSWSAPSGSGALLVMPESADLKRPSDLTPRLISLAAEKCKGKFMSGAMPEENGAARSFSSCQIGTGEPSTGYYTAVPRSAGGHYVIMIWPTAGGSLQSSKQEPDQDIRNAAYKVLR